MPPKTTQVGGCVMAPTFFLATIVVFANGMITFGVGSLLFIATAALHGVAWPANA